MIDLIVHGLTWVVLAVAMHSCVRARRLRREYETLNALIRTMAVQSFMRRHLPIWVAWSAMTGLKVRIVVEDQDEREASGK